MTENEPNRYSCLLFDADGTLFDYDKAEKSALRGAFNCVEAIFRDEYLETYRCINKQLWEALERREIAASALSVRRFEMLLEALELTCSAAHLSQAYLEQLSLSSELIEDAFEVLHQLSEKFVLAVVTNGFQAVQRSRLERSSIKSLIQHLIISEEVGAAKPKAAFFDAAFARLNNPRRDEVLLIGDSLTADIRGGVDYGIDTCWFNPMGLPRPDGLSITYEIKVLKELLGLLSRH